MKNILLPLLTVILFYPLEFIEAKKPRNVFEKNKKMYVAKAKKKKYKKRYIRRYPYKANIYISGDELKLRKMLRELYE